MSHEIKITMYYVRLILVPLSFTGLGVYLLIMLGLAWYHQQSVVAAATPSVAVSSRSSVKQDKAAISGLPRHISIPAVNIDTVVSDGTYDASSASWTITEDSAFYATVTDPINNESGNTFIYGHNSEKIFGNIRHMTTGAVATVRTDNGYRFTYKYTSSEEVRPDDAQVLDYSGAPRLMLQTCAGAWNELREIVYFKLVDYKKL